MSDRRKSAADKLPGECTGPYTFVKLLGEGTFSKVLQRVYSAFYVDVRARLAQLTAFRMKYSQVYLVQREPAAEGEEKQQARPSASAAFAFRPVL